MAITDELRDWANSFHPYKDYPDLRAIADRIDAEHERQVNYAKIAFWHDASEEELYHYGLMRGPIDADGVPIRVGDVMELPSGKRDKVRFMTVNGGGWLVNEECWFPDKLRHHRPPTVEDVLEEMYDALEDARIPNGSEKRTYEEIIAEYAAKLRLAGEDE